MKRCCSLIALALVVWPGAATAASAPGLGEPVPILTLQAEANPLEATSNGRG